MLPSEQAEIAEALRAMKQANAGECLHGWQPAMPRTVSTASHRVAIGRRSTPGAKFMSYVRCSATDGVKMHGAKVGGGA